MLSGKFSLLGQRPGDFWLAEAQGLLKYIYMLPRDFLRPNGRPISRYCFSR